MVDPDPPAALLLLKRKGARTTAEVPPDVRRLISTGALETVNLSEWLVVDHELLVTTTFDALGWGTWTPHVIDTLASLPKPTSVKKVAAVGTHLAAHYAETPRSLDKLIAALVRHRSDVVRSWVPYLIGCSKTINLREKLARVRPLAADPNMGVREAAWSGVRASIASEVLRSIELLCETGWVTDPDPRVRRFASEATRPRGVWCAHIQMLKDTPVLGLPILEPLKTDSAKYVQDSVGNWLNDASKSQPDWTRDVCDRWIREIKSTTSASAFDPVTKAIAAAATARIVRRGLRTLDK